MSEIPAEDVEALIELFAASGWTELHLALDGFELTLSNDAAFEGRAVGTSPQALASTSAPLAPAAATTAATTAAALSSRAVESDSVTLVVIRAPNLGHFYRAPKPGAAPFVEVGSRVGSDDIVCVIEVMKLFTLLPAGVAGIVTRICVEDAAMVEFDQPLFYIEPDS